MVYAMRKKHGSVVLDIFLGMGGMVVGMKQDIHA